MVDASALDQITQQFITALKQDANYIETAAKHLFYYLVVIQLALSALFSALSGKSLQRTLTEFVILSFSLGFFAGLIQLGREWMPALLNGFIELGQQSSGITSLDPSSIVAQGVSIAGSMFRAFFGFGLLAHPFMAFFGAALCLGTLCIYGLIAAELVIALVKAYMLLVTQGLFFALGALKLTVGCTKRYFSALMGLGIHLMSVYLLLGVGLRIGVGWSKMIHEAALQHDLMPMLVIMCAILIYFMVLKTIPPFMASLVDIDGAGGKHVSMSKVNLSTRPNLLRSFHVISSRK